MQHHTENIAFSEFFFPSLAWAKRTLNKFISQQKHHSAELSIPFPFSVSLQLDFSLSRTYLIPSPLLLRLSISNELGFIRLFFARSSGNMRFFAVSIFWKSKTKKNSCLMFIQNAVFRIFMLQFCHLLLDQRTL